MPMLAGRRGFGVPDSFITDFMTMLVTIEPFAVIPVFLVLTNGLSAAEKRRTAFGACLIATLILLFFLVVGLLLVLRVKQR